MYHLRSGLLIRVGRNAEARDVVDEMSGGEPPAMSGDLPFEEHSVRGASSRSARMGFQPFMVRSFYLADLCAFAPAARNAEPRTLAGIQTYVKALWT